MTYQECFYLGCRVAVFNKKNFITCFKSFKCNNIHSVYSVVNVVKINFFTQRYFSSILSILAASSSIFLQSAGISLRYPTSA